MIAGITPKYNYKLCNIHCSRTSTTCGIDVPVLRAFLTTPYTMIDGAQGTGRCGRKEDTTCFGFMMVNIANDPLRYYGMPLPDGYDHHMGEFYDAYNGLSTMPPQWLGDKPHPLRGKA